HQEAPGPARLAPAPDLLEASADVARRRKDDAAQALRIGATILVHPAMVGAIHRHLERHIVAAGPGSKPARWQGQVDVHALVVEILDTLGRIAVAAWSGLSVALHP